MPSAAKPYGMADSMATTTVLWSCWSFALFKGVLPRSPSYSMALHSTCRWIHSSGVGSLGWSQAMVAVPAETSPRRPCGMRPRLPAKPPPTSSVTGNAVGQPGLVMSAPRGWLRGAPSNKAQAYCRMVGPQNCSPSRATEVRPQMAAMYQIRHCRAKPHQRPSPAPPPTAALRFCTTRACLCRAHPCFAPLGCAPAVQLSRAAACACSSASTDAVHGFSFTHLLYS